MKRDALIYMAVMASAIAAPALLARQSLWFNGTDDIARGLDAANVKKVTSNGTDVTVDLRNDSTLSVPVSSFSNVTLDADTTGTLEVVVTFNGTEASVVNPLAFEGVEVTRQGAHVTVNSTCPDEVEYRLKGSSTDGQFKLYSVKKQIVKLDGLSLTNASGSAVNIQSKKKTTIKAIKGTVNNLVDAAKYTTTPALEDEKATLFSEGQLIFEGKGTINVTGNYKHAIASDDYVSITEADVNVLSAANDGIHVNDYFEMTGGKYTSTATVGDGIDGGTGYVAISGGTINVSIATADTKAIKADSIMTISGGDITLNVTGDQSKGLSSKQTITVTGSPVIRATLSGGVVVTAGDPSYCTAIKPKGDFVMDGGSIEITHTGLAGKGISADGNINISGGSFNMNMSGGAGTYTNAANEADSYSSTCIKADGNLNVTGGTFVLRNTGTAGKGISVDGDAVYGIVGADDAAINIDITTSGQKLAEGNSQSPSGGGGRPGWPGGGGFPGQDGDYTNPKVIKTKGALTMNSGTYTLKSTADGGEGLESKTVLTVNGGLFDIQTVDDCINAANQVVFNGGKLRCYASNNDAIDSNGTMTINGGLIIAYGSTAPEEGFDCDQNQFKITGGTFIGLGGGTSTPTASVCTQCAVIYRASLAKGTQMTVADASGRNILSLTNQRSYSGTVTMLFGSPDIQKSQTYTVKTGATVIGGDKFNELIVGGTVSGGTQSTTFTPSSYLTQIGTSGGGGRW